FPELYLARYVPDDGYEVDDLSGLAVYGRYCHVDIDQLTGLLSPLLNTAPLPALLADLPDNGTVITAGEIIGQLVSLLPDKLVAPVSAQSRTSGTHVEHVPRRTEDANPLTGLLYRLGKPQEDLLHSSSPTDIDADTER